ncbi:MAG: matrixin family metalloprotease [Alphaproteobacteria bacterium]
MRRIPAAVWALLVGVACLPAPVLAESGYRLLRLDGGFLKWGTARMGEGATVTYALADGPRVAAKARNCGRMTAMTALLDGAGIDLPEFLGELRAAFRMWETVADLQFELIEDADAAQIVIGAQTVPRGRAYANVSYDQQVGGPHRLTRSLVCLNPAMAWKVGFGGAAGSYDLRYVLAHEIGHAIGLDHAGIRTHLMSFRYTETRRGLSAGDAAGAAALYGRPANLSKTALKQ